MSSNSPDTEQIRPLVVRTLKPPPEIWELVQPVEGRQSTPLLPRLRSSGASFILFALVGGLVLGAGAAFWQFRSAQKPAARKTTQPVQVGATFSRDVTTKSAVSTAAPIETTVTQPADVNVSDSSSRPTARPSKRKVSIASPAQPDIASSAINIPRSTQAPKTDRQSGTATNTGKNPADAASAKPKANATLNSTVIAPAKPASTPKAKVIQWP